MPHCWLTLYSAILHFYDGGWFHGWGCKGDMCKIPTLPSHVDGGRVIINEG